MMLYAAACTDHENAVLPSSFAEAVVVDEAFCKLDVLAVGQHTLGSCGFLQQYFEACWFGFILDCTAESLLPAVGTRYLPAQHTAHSTQRHHMMDDGI